MRRKAGVLGIILLSALLSLQVMAAPQDSDSEVVQCPRKVKVTAVEVGTSLFEEFAKFTARFEPQSEKLISTVSGKLTKMHVAEGNLVSRDFLVMELDNALADAIATQKQEIATWKKILKRRSNWKERSPKAEAQAKRKIKAAMDQVAELEAGITARQLTAPIPGRIENLSLEEGMDVEAGSVVAVLINDNLMFARIPIEANEAALFNTGREITLGDGMVVTVHAVTDDQVTLSMENSDKKIKAGDSIQFKILRQRHPEAIVLSREQVLSDEIGQFVFVVNGKTARRAALKLGAEDNGKVLVADGLNAGEFVITHEVLSAKEGILKPAIQCVVDGGRIRLVRKDPETGRFVKAEKVPVSEVAETVTQPVVEEEPEEKPEEKPETVIPEKPAVETITEEGLAPGNFFSLGVGAGYASLSDENFNDVYGGGFDAQFKLAYTLKGKYEIFIEVSYWQKEGVIEAIDLDTKLVMAPLYVGARYLFDTNSKFKPYLGLAWTVFNNKETNDFIPDASFDTQHGVCLLGGTYYSVGPNVDIYGTVRYDMGKKTIEGFDEEADLGGLRLHLGVVYKFTR